MKLIPALLLVLAIVVTALLTTAMYVADTAKNSSTMRMDLTVSDTLGFNIDADAVHFGRVPPGQASIKTITLNNTRATPRVADLQAEGVLGSWIAVSDNHFLLQPGEYRSINLTATVPENTSYGTYTGTLTAVFRKP